jgi:hypothetical protein
MLANDQKGIYTNTAQRPMKRTNGKKFVTCTAFLIIM